jgi:hypothetical protein
MVILPIRLVYIYICFAVAGGGGGEQHVGGGFDCVTVVGLHWSPLRSPVLRDERVRPHARAGGDVARCSVCKWITYGLATRLSSPSHTHLLWLGNPARVRFIVASLTVPVMLTVPCV